MDAHLQLPRCGNIIIENEATEKFHYHKHLISSMLQQFVKIFFRKLFFSIPQESNFSRGVFFEFLWSTCPLSNICSVIQKIGRVSKNWKCRVLTRFFHRQKFFPRMVISNHISLFSGTTSQTSQHLLRILHVYEIYSNWNWLYWVSWWEIEIWFCMFVILQMQKPVGFVLK